MLTLDDFGSLIISISITQSDLSRRAREIYAATAPARDARTVSTIEKPQKAEL